MKAVLVLTLSFLFAFLSNLPLAFSKDGAELVKDTKGNPLSRSGKYYIMPANNNPPPRGGGLRLAMTENTDCPVTVLQDYSEDDRGIPVKFSTGFPGFIFTDTKLDIEFTKKPNCADTSEWSVFEDRKIRTAYVGIGGPEAHPGDKMLSGGFSIQKYGSRYNTYKLVFCRDDSSTCLDIGRYDNHNEDGKLLVLTQDKPFEVVFVDAYNYNRDATIKSVV